MRPRQESHKLEIAKARARESNLLREYMRTEEIGVEERPAESSLLPLKVVKPVRHPRDTEFLTPGAIEWLTKLKYNIPLIVEGRIRQKHSSNIHTFTVAGRVIVFSTLKGGLSRFEEILRPIVTDLWNNGDINKDDLASILGVSSPTAQRLVREYNLPHKCSMDRPYIKGIVWKARKLYSKGWSTLQIGERLHYNDETIRKWLILSGVKLRSKGEKNLLIQYYGTKDQNKDRTMSARQFAKKIKEMAYEGRLMKDMERELGMFRVGIAARMKMMGVYDPWVRKRKELIRAASEGKKEVRMERQNLIRRIKYRQDPEYRKKMSEHHKRWYDKLRAQMEREGKTREAKKKALENTVVAEYLAGGTYISIAKKLGIHMSTISNIIKRKNVPLRMPRLSAALRKANQRKYLRDYENRPDVKAKRKAQRSSPEEIAKRKKYQREYYRKNKRRRNK